MSFKLRVNVYGLGYTGTISALCLASKNHSVTAYDKQQQLVDDFNSNSPSAAKSEATASIIELKGEGMSLTALSIDAKIVAADIHMICVGTPASPLSGFELKQLEDITVTIAKSLHQESSTPPIVLVRSTILPGTLRDFVLPLLETSSGLTEGKDFLLAALPEFLREGNGVVDTWNPLHFLLGPASKFDDMALSKVRALFQVTKNLEILTPEECAMVKLSSNLFHAAKITFANEVGSICSKLGVNAQTVLDFIKNETNNRQPQSYLNPGLPYGGPCLSKDLLAIKSLTTLQAIETPLINSIESSNHAHLNRLVETILQESAHEIGFLGISFKPGAHDIRGSVFIKAIELLKLKRPSVKISLYDEPTLTRSLEEAIRREVHIANSEIDLLQRGRLILLGSYLPSEKFLSQMSISKNRFIDLKFFPDLSPHLQKLETNINFLC